MNAAVIGLGSMGYGIATSILRAGQRVWGFDVNEARVAEFLAAGGQQGALADVAATIDTVVTVVLNAEQTEAVLFGDEGVVGGLKAGAVVIACATVPPEFARAMEARCADHGVHFLDAPISGGSVSTTPGKTRPDKSSPSPCGNTSAARRPGSTT